MFSTKSRRLLGIPARVWYLIASLIVLSVAGAAIARHVYYEDLKPVSAAQTSQVVTIESGSSVRQIATQLKNYHLIRSAWAFQLYVHSKELTDKLQAGSYALSPGQSISQMVSILTKGRVSTELVTIVPGERIDQVRASLINYGFKPADVDQALTGLSQYADLPIMAFKPASVNTLEGLLWPDSWYKDANSSASDIVRQSLQEAGQHLTPDVQAALAAENLTVYQGITLASVVIQEVNRPTDQAQAAQVFLSRLKAGTKMQSDVTARYGAIEAGQAPSLTYDSPYNTLLHAGLPPTPISSINQTALAAVVHPASTGWLYFVTGDDGTTYFSTNLQDHQALTQKYCHKLCGQ